MTGVKNMKLRNTNFCNSRHFEQSFNKLYTYIHSSELNYIIATNCFMPPRQLSGDYKLCDTLDF